MLKLHASASRPPTGFLHFLAVAAALIALMGGTWFPITTAAAEEAAQDTAPVQETSTEEATASATAETPPTQVSPAQFHIGDRLQISFFEHLELPPPGGSDSSAMTAAMRTFYQRLDLTGEYNVEMDGTIAIPLLGRFSVGGKTLEELRDEISTTFQQQIGRSGEVYVNILARQPVFVLGVVRNPGSYPFSPGMIALQAIALAGGFERLPEGAPQHMELRRERERLAQAMQRLKRLTAQRARLTEERDGQRVAASHPILAQAAQDADEMLEGERSLGEVEAAVRQGEAELHGAALESARGELETLRESATLFNQQIEARTERLRVLQQMQGRGVANLEAVWGAQKDLTDLELQREQLLSAIHVAEQKVVQAELTQSKVDLEHRARITRDLVAVEDEIAGLETTITTARDMVRTLEAALRGLGADDKARIEILRRTDEGVLNFVASESEELAPGDVIKVVAERLDMMSTAQTERR
ncbi:polysaccharide biosynthesis/export family protein [Chelativorans sp. Marseille-P2723]|uniref:polysaccharide biosynthesis/export family protein n=1 Tax=Chelativorans sp. Marseille-P2723 TaxID=2709133 RepID=UPI0015706F84|nr:polysaccharide biosynthesis/export family protein [Chelativorans sp. Marseille-P2723]